MKLLSSTFALFAVFYFSFTAYAGGGSESSGDPTSTSTRGGGEYRLVQGHIVLRDLVEGESCLWISGRELAKDAPEFQTSLTKLRAMHWLYADRLEKAINEITFCMTNYANENADGVIAGNLAARTGEIVRLKLSAFNAMDIPSQGLTLVHEAMHSYFLDSLPQPEHPLRLRSFIHALQEIPSNTTNESHLNSFRQEITLDSIGWPTNPDTLRALAPLQKAWDTIFDLSRPIDAQTVEDLFLILNTMSDQHDVHNWILPSEGRRIADVLSLAPKLLREAALQKDAATALKLVRLGVGEKPLYLQSYKIKAYPFTSNPLELSVISPLTSFAIKSMNQELLSAIHQQWPDAFDYPYALCQIPSGAPTALWQQILEWIPSNRYKALNLDCEQRLFIGYSKKHPPESNSRLGRALIFKVLDERRTDLLSWALQYAEHIDLGTRDEQCRRPVDYAQDLGDSAARTLLLKAESRSLMGFGDSLCWNNRKMTPENIRRRP